jgi:hypothetical protein
MAPGVPSESNPQAATNAGLDPAKFLIAAADMHNSGALSAPVPTGTDPLPARPRRPAKHLKILK